MIKTITKSQYPEINWSVVDDALKYHNKRFAKSYELVLALENPPFKQHTRIVIYCEQHQEYLTTTTPLRLYNSDYYICPSCVGKHDGKWKSILSYQEEINKAFGTNNYQIHLRSPYKGHSTYVRLYCQKHQVFSKYNQMRKLKWEAIHYPDTFWQCRECRKENKKRNN